LIAWYFYILYFVDTEQTGSCWPDTYRKPRTFCIL